MELPEYCQRCGREPRYEGPWCLTCARADRPGWLAACGPFVRAHRAFYLAGAGVPVAFRHCGFDTYQANTREQRNTLDALQGWAAGECKTGLYLAGPVGTGKTHLAVSALLELLVLRRKGRYVSARELVLSLRAAYGGGEDSVSVVLDRCSSPDALVLDDVGTGKSSEFVAECVDLLVDRAYSNLQPLVVMTSNLDLGQLGYRLDERIADRLRELCVEVRVGGPSFRRRLGSPVRLGQRGAVQISRRLAE